MTNAEFPPELKVFLDEQIESLASLETLLLLRSERDRDWGVAEVGKTLYTSTDMCEGQLADLVRRGFVATTQNNTRYRYAPSDVAMARLIDELAAIYPKRRVTIITLIYSKPQSKVRTLADAFRLRREN